MKNVFLGIFMLMLLAATSPAVDQVVTGVTAYATREHNANTYAPADADNAANGAGFTADPNGFTGTHANLTAGHWYVTWTSTAARGPVGQWIRFELPQGVKTLKKIRVWNYNNSAAIASGMKDVMITATDWANNIYTNLGNYTLPQASGAASYTGYEIDIPDVANPRYVQITPYSTYGAINNFVVGLSEVKFWGDFTPGITTFSAGADQRVTLDGASVVVNLDGTVAETAATTWSVSSGPAAVTFGDPAAVDTTATFTVAGSYVLELSRNDGYASDLVVIRVMGVGYDGLIGHWSFESNTNDASGYGNNGIVHGNPQYVAGKIGQALSFDGYDDGVEIPNESHFDRVISVYPEMTVTFWAKMPYGVRPHGYALSKMLYDIANVKGTGWGFLGYPNLSPGNIVAYAMQRNIDTKGAYAPPLSSVYWFNPLNDGRWHHYTLRAQYSSGTTHSLVLLIDGAGVGGFATYNTFSNSIFNEEPITLGFCKSFEGGMHWEGALDEVRFYDYNLTNDEVKALFEADGGTRCTETLAGDVNNDCQVDLADLDLLLDTWLGCTNYFPQDCF